MVLQQNATPEAVLPLTLERWEKALVSHFLCIRAEDDAGPIRSFEITAETLAEATGVVDLSPAEAEDAFRSALRNDGYLRGALEKGDCRPRTREAPNCFTYLAMTLLIDTLMDGDYSDQGVYREKLQTWLRADNKFVKLSGIAHMWIALDLWLDARIAEGAEFRRLTLPDPGAWTQIGHTRKLSFPTRADARFIESVIVNSGKGLSNPQNLLRSIQTELNTSKASVGMKLAFEEFRDFYQVQAATTDHRFWRFLQRCASSRNGSRQFSALVSLSFDEDSTLSIRVSTDNPDCLAAEVQDLREAFTSQAVEKSSNLGLISSRGWALFRQIGAASWRSEPDFPDGSSCQVRLAISVSRIPGAHKKALAGQINGGWLLTDSMLAIRAKSTLDLLFGIKLQRNPVLDIVISDGVRVSGGALLGRSAYLPHIAAGDCTVHVSRVHGQKEGAHVIVDTGIMQSDGRVDGAYAICVQSKQGKDAPDWVRHVRFTSDAAPHPDLIGSSYQQQLAKEWVLEQASGSLPFVAPETSWSDQDSSSTDILEILYATSPSGRAEGDVIDVISRGTNGQANPWAVLRCIHEAGFLEARYRGGWRGRIWTLGVPKLRPVKFRDRTVVVVEGALCAALEQEFFRVVKGLQGEPFRIHGVSEWSPPIIGAGTVDSAELSRRLDWKLAAASECSRPILRPNGLETSRMMGEHHQPLSTWDWSKGRFVLGKAAESEVSLTRFVHPGGRDHDIYRVHSGQHISSHMTRNAAILKAYILKRAPLFKVQGDKIVRAPGDGALPLEIARWLRLRFLRGGGPLPNGGYAYPIDAAELANLKRALPACVAGTAAQQRASTEDELVLQARRSGGRARLIWVSGKVEVRV